MLLASFEIVLHEFVDEELLIVVDFGKLIVVMLQYGDLLGFGFLRL